jgi:hypothetical protein
MLTREQYETRYPHAISYDEYVKSSAMISRFYSRASAEVSADLVAEHEYNKAKEWSTD